MSNFLTHQERIELKVQHKRERDKRICDRIKAILLYDNGWTYTQIAEALLLSDDAIRQHVNEYNDSRKLKTNNGGSREKLSADQSMLLEQHLQKHIYLYIKDIVEYVKFSYGVTYTISGLRNWLQRHAFSYKKPSLVPGKANIEQQRQWILEYEKLKSGLGPDETICFMDGVHPTHNPQVTCGWIKKGVRKELAANSGRSRLNLSGVLDLLSKKLIIQEDKTLNGEATISFLKKVEEAYPTKKTIHIFCDNAGYYRSRLVTNYLEGSKIKMHFLPPYSPNLNPIERVWKWMKERVIYNTYYEEFEDFRFAVIGFLKGISKIASDSEFGQAFSRKIRDKFRPLGSTIPDS